MREFDREFEEKEVVITRKDFATAMAESVSEVRFSLMLMTPDSMTVEENDLLKLIDTLGTMLGAEVMYRLFDEAEEE